VTLEKLYGVTLESFDCMLGPSLGECTAAVISGSLSLEDGLKLAQFRGKVMQEAVQNHSTAMVAIKLSHKVVQAAIDGIKLEGICEVSGLTNPKQTLVSGDEAAVSTLVSHLKNSNKAVSVPLKVSAPFHCSLMAPAAQRLAGYLQSLTFNPLRRPIVPSSNSELVVSPTQLLASLSRNVTEPMRLQGSIETALGRGVRTFVELGPQRKMSAHIRAITRGWVDVAVSQHSPDSL
jgi:[acyl-carrier-protein] S-malonyltransferase